MHVGVLTLSLSIEYAQSLKDKRQAVKSIVTRVRNRFNVSAAEVGELDTWRRSVVAVAAVSNSAAIVQQILNHVADYVADDHNVILDDFSIEMV